MSAVRARLSAVRPGVWLTAIVVGSIVLRMLLAGRTPSPWIMVDELIYSELGKSLASSGQFLVRGVPSTGYGFVYPVLLAPAFRLFAFGADRVPRCKADQRGRHVTDGGAGVLPRATDLDAGSLARSRGARRAAAVDALHRDTDDRERVLSAVRARVTRPRADARAADRAAPAAVTRDVRRLLCDTRAGDRALRRRSGRAGAARVDRTRSRREAQALHDALRHYRRRCRARSARNGGARALTALPPRRLPGGDRQRLLRLGGRALPALARRRARPLPRRDRCRRPDRDVARAAHADARGARVRRGDPADHPAARRGGRDLRVAPVRRGSRSGTISTSRRSRSSRCSGSLRATPWSRWRAARA